MEWKFMQKVRNWNDPRRMLMYIMAPKAQVFIHPRRLIWIAIAACTFMYNTESEWSTRWKRFNSKLHLFIEACTPEFYVTSYFSYTECSPNAIPEGQKYIRHARSEFRLARNFYHDGIVERAESPRSFATRFSARRDSSAVRTASKKARKDRASEPETDENGNGTR